MKHTKGPWIVDPIDSLSIVNENNDASLKWIVDVPEGYDQDNLSGIEERMANALLISASPDLLESLIETLSCIDQHTDDEVLGPIIERAKIAIAKAKGN
jgi:hypothetical protein